MKHRWNATPSIAGGGVLMDNGTHSVDIARYLLGPIAAIQAQAGARGQDIDVEDTAHVLFRTRSGVVGQIDLTWSMQRCTQSFIDVYGTEGTVSIGWHESRRRLAGDAALTPFGSGYDKNAAFRNQLQNFIDAVRGRAEPRIGPADAMAAVSVIEAAYASLRQDKWMAPQSREGQ
jgi:predicted dehydrogenase